MVAGRWGSQDGKTRFDAPATKAFSCEEFESVARSASFSTLTNPSSKVVETKRNNFVLPFLTGDTFSISSSVNSLSARESTTSAAT